MVVWRIIDKRPSTFTVKQAEAFIEHPTAAAYRSQHHTAQDHIRRYRFGIIAASPLINYNGRSSVQPTQYMQTIDTAHHTAHSGYSICAATIHHLATASRSIEAAACPWTSQCMLARTSNSFPLGAWGLFSSARLAVLVGLVDSIIDEGRRSAQRPDSRCAASQQRMDGRVVTGRRSTAVVRQ